MSRLLLGVGAASMIALAVPAADLPPTADQIVERLISRSKETAPDVSLRWHQCRRVTTTEELDEEGKVTRTRTRELRVVSTNGVESVQPWSGGGADSADEDGDPSGDSAEMDDRKGSGQVKSRRPGPAKPKVDRKGKGGSKELGEEIFRQFQYTLEGEEVFRGRTNFVLRFSGKPGRSGGDIGERLLRQFEGRLWIDSADFELSKVDAHLGRTFDVFGGFAASIQKLDFQMERQPIGEGLWETGLVATEIQGRKVFSSMRSRYRMEQDRFVGGRKPAGGAAAPGGQP